MNNNILISFILLTNCALRFSNLHVVTCSCLLGMQNMATSSTTKSGKTLDPKVRVHMLRMLQFTLCVKYLKILDNEFYLLSWCQQTIRRLAQNREAARKSRLRKKVMFWASAIWELKFSAATFPSSWQLILLMCHRLIFSSLKVASWSLLRWNRTCSEPVPRYTYNSCVFCLLTTNWTCESMKSEVLNSCLGTLSWWSPGANTSSGA